MQNKAVPVRSLVDPTSMTVRSLVDPTSMTPASRQEQARAKAHLHIRVLLKRSGSLISF
jgi:hypothetical protein